MRALKYTVRITAIVGLVFLLSACGKPGPGKGATSASPSTAGARQQPGLPTGTMSPGQGAEPRFQSAKPRYAKLALMADPSKILSVAFDESEGTGQGYDIVYVDTNFNGRFEQREAVKARLRELPITTASFGPINVELPYNERAKGIPNPCSLSFLYRGYPGNREFLLRGTTRLAQGSVQWEYDLSEDLKPSEALASAPVAGFTRAPALTVTTKPDLEKKGNLGIALGVVAGKTEVRCTRGQAAPEAHVIIRDRKGGIVHEATAAADKFAFG